MTLDIRGSLKNTKISANRYVVLEELISNSIDSFLIRQHQDPLVRSLDVRVVAEILTTSVVDGAQDLCISCTDNGCGLGEEQMEAFLTKDTSYKDDLSIAGIGKCKGAGRIQYFHHFERVGIRSTYQSDGNPDQPPGQRSSQNQGPGQSQVSALIALAYNCRRLHRLRPAA